MEKPKLSLVLLKKLVEDLETAVNAAEKVREGQNLSVDEPQANAVFNQFYSEMGKVSGLCTYLSTEALALNKDCMQVVKYSRMPDRSEEMNPVDLFGGLFGSPVDKGN